MKKARKNTGVHTSARLGVFLIDTLVPRKFLHVFSDDHLGRYFTSLMKNQIIDQAVHCNSGQQTLENPHLVNQ